MLAAATYSLAVQSCSRQAGCAAGGLLSGLHAQGRGLPKGGGGARGQLPPHQQQDQAHEPGVSPPPVASLAGAAGPYAWCSSGGYGLRVLQPVGQALVNERLLEAPACILLNQDDLLAVVQVPGGTLLWLRLLAVLCGSSAECLCRWRMSFWPSMRGQLLEKEHSGCAALLQDDKVAAQPDQLIGQAQHRLAVLQ